MPQRALFLDRDGVINHEVGYLYKSEEVRFVEGIFPLTKTAQDLGYKLVVVTNQSGIARGYYTVAHFEELMAWMRAEFWCYGVRIDRVYYCPYHPEHGIGEYKREHEDRKPQPGMLRHAARDLDLELSECVMIGDRCSDVAAANSAGLRKVFLLAGTEPGSCGGLYEQIGHLEEVRNWLIADSRRKPNAKSAK